MSWRGLCSHNDYNYGKDNDDDHSYDDNDDDTDGISDDNENIFNHIY